ncbi:MAG: peroxiredoxin [Nitrosomonas sp.]|nr:peroxiredoxin [Nitrosomonas sp.]
MDWLFILTILVVAGMGVRLYFSGKITLQPGQPAPDFRLKDQHGQIHTLADFKGKWLALYFYPKDDTPGCTRQACAFRDDLDTIKALGAEVVGVSVDTVESHIGFAGKFGLSFPLLADHTTETAARYHSLINLGVIKFARRNTFLIDSAGKIAKIYPSASARHNSSEVISDLQQLKQAETPDHSN